MDEAAKLRTAGSNVFLGGTPASERFDTSYATTFVDTKDMLVDESKNTAALREDMRQQGQVQHFELGAEHLDYSTSGHQDDHFRRRTDEDRARMAADARLHAFKKKDMQQKHFELGLKKTDYTSLAAASFRWDAEVANKESAATRAEAKARSTGAQRTNFAMGAAECDFKSEAAAAFAPPAVEPAGDAEKLPPLAKSTNITIGLVPVDYTTAYQDTNQTHLRERAALGEPLRAHTGGAGLRATNWTLGLDDNKKEGHYTSETMKELWHERVPTGKGVGAAAVRTVSAYKDRRVVPAAVCDDSPEFLASLRSMARK